jgi:hypothetical protein
LDGKVRPFLPLELVLTGAQKHQCFQRTLHSLHSLRSGCAFSQPWPNQPI